MSSNNDKKKKAQNPDTPDAAKKDSAEQAPEAAQQPDEAATAKEEAAKAKEDLAAEHDKYLRILAEYDNFRKRSARERDSIYADVKADTLTKILPIFDNLERALRQETADEAYRKGVEMTMKQFMDALKTLGVTPVETVGKTFNPHEHNAVMHTEDPDKGENVIVQEFQKGFKLGDRVIRFSMVQVAN